MTHRDDLDRMLSVWLDDPYTPPAPHYLGQVLERTRRTRQRPAWANFERWLPMAEKISRINDRAAAADGLALARRAARGGPGRRRRDRGLAAPHLDSRDPPRWRRRDRVRVRPRCRDAGRHLHRQGRWHGPAPADEVLQRCWGGPGPGMVARWHAHRLPRLPRVEELGRGDGRGWREPDDVVVERRRTGPGLR